MSLYTDEIRWLLDNRISAVPYVLLVDYLRKTYNLSQYAAEEAIYAAARARQVTESNGYIVRPKKPQLDSQTIAKAKAFAVVVEFLPDATNFCSGYTPWVYAFLKDGKVFQVGYMRRGDEFGQSHLLRNRPVPEEERDNFVRILVVEPNVDLSKIQNVGYSFYCTVDEKDNYNIEVIKKIPREEAWENVPTK